MPVTKYTTKYNSLKKATCGLRFIDTDLLFSSLQSSDKYLRQINLKIGRWENVRTRRQLGSLACRPTPKAQFPYVTQSGITWLRAASRLSIQAHRQSVTTPLCPTTAGLWRTCSIFSKPTAKYHKDTKSEALSAAVWLASSINSHTSFGGFVLVNKLDWVLV